MQPKGVNEAASAVIPSEKVPSILSACQTPAHLETNGVARRASKAPRPRDVIAGSLIILNLARAAPEPRPQRRHGRVRRPPVS